MQTTTKKKPKLNKQVSQYSDHVVYWKYFLQGTQLHAPPPSSFAQPPPVSSSGIALTPPLHLHNSAPLCPLSAGSRAPDWCSCTLRVGELTCPLLSRVHWALEMCLSACVIALSYVIGVYRCRWRCGLCRGTSLFPPSLSHHLSLQPCSHSSSLISRLITTLSAVYLQK